ADGADRFGFDKDDPAAAAAEESRQRRGGHPARGTSADNDDAPDCPCLGHCPVTTAFGQGWKPRLGLPVRDPVAEVAAGARDDRARLEPADAVAAAILAAGP